MIVEMGGWETHIGANQRCRQFSRQLLERIGLIAESLAEGSGKPVWMTGPAVTVFEGEFPLYASATPELGSHP